MNKNNISQIKWNKVKSNQVKWSQVKSSEVKSSRVKSYTHIWEIENGSKGNDYSIIVVIIIFINIVIYIDDKRSIRIIRI